MKKMLWLVLLIPGMGIAQFYFYNEKFYDSPLLVEAGISSGMINALTDIGGKAGEGKKFISDIDWRNSNHSFGFFLAANYKQAISLRLGGCFGKVASGDKSLKRLAASTAGRYERNLHFQSRITEWNLLVELYPATIFSSTSAIPLLAPYVLSGVGLFSFDPQAKLHDNWYSLQPLRTEGQGFAEYPGRKPYKLTQHNIAIGCGLKYEISARSQLRLELLHRILFTDYLDDVSTTYIDPAHFYIYLPAGYAGIARQLADRQGELDPGHITIAGGQRGNPGKNDAYFTVQVAVCVLLGREKR